MKILSLFLEISDKVPEVQTMYITYIVLGAIGLLLGIWRWWISLIWLVFSDFNVCRIRRKRNQSSLSGYD
jgi:hypothetical protein